jgi:regulator of protease activity HflC (stomatin/prohibitin superfamily)
MSVLLGASMAGLFNFAVWGIVFLVLIIQFLKSIRLVPTRRAYMVERLGKYHRTLGPGFHALIPFVEKVDSIVDLREETIDVPPQECFTRDEVMVQVDGVLYIEVVEPEKAVYGITDYRFAAVQLAQTTTRSVIGTIDLDRSFEERDLISSRVVEELANAGQAWGIRVLRYEVRNIAPLVARAEGDRESAINKSEGERTEMINQSEGTMQRAINEAEGRADEIRQLADATAQSIERIAEALSMPGGDEAVRLRLTERYLAQLAELRTPDTRILLPADLSNLDALLHSVGLDAPQKR